MQRLLFFLTTILASCLGLKVVPDSPGAIPTLPTNLTQTTPGGQNPLRLFDPSVFDRTWNLVNFAVDEAQAPEVQESDAARKSYIKHKPTALVRGASQTANGEINDVIFVVGKVNCIPPISGPPQPPQVSPPQPPSQDKVKAHPTMRSIPTVTPRPWYPGPYPFFRCFLLDTEDSYAKCYIKFVYQVRDHSVQVQKYTCVQIGKNDAKQLLGTKEDLAKSYSY